MRLLLRSPPSPCAHLTLEDRVPSLPANMISPRNHHASVEPFLVLNPSVHPFSPPREAMAVPPISRTSTWEGLPCIFWRPAQFSIPPPQSMTIAIGVPTFRSCVAPRRLKLCQRTASLPVPFSSNDIRVLPNASPEPCHAPLWGVKPLDGPQFAQELDPLSHPGPHLLLSRPPS